MQTTSIEQKLDIILRAANLFKKEIDKAIEPISTELYVNSKVLKELQNLPISKFIDLSREALSEFNASTCENSPLSIPVKRIIEEFTEIKVLINPSSISKIAFFPSVDKKIDLQQLKKNLTAINEIFNMHSYPTPDLTDKSLIKSLTLEA